MKVHEIKNWDSELAIGTIDQVNHINNIWLGNYKYGDFLSKNRKNYLVH